MRANWIEIKRGDVQPQWSGIYVTLNRKGEIVLSRRTWERMNEAKAFLLLFDPANNRIRLKQTAPQIRNAYPVRTHSSRGAVKIRAFRLLSEHRISVPETLPFHDADIDEDGILVLDLRTARVSERAKNHAANKARRESPHGVKV